MLDRLVNAITHGANAVTASVLNLIAGVARLNLVAVFVIYSAVLIEEFYNRANVVSLLIIGSTAVFLILAGWIFVNSARRTWGQDIPAARLGSLWICGAPAALVILATAIVGCWEPARFKFQQPLLVETTHQADRFLYWITHL